MGIGKMGEGEGQAGLETNLDAVGRDTSLSRATLSPSSVDDAAATRLPWWQRAIRRAIHAWFYLSRGMTLGVRVIVMDGPDKVFLVRHTYISGWHLPGGGIEWGQSALEALAMELREEGNLTAITAPELVGFYWNRHASRRDHVVVYGVRAAHQSAPRLPDKEIAEARFFPLESLPAGVTPGTKRRLAEWLDGAPRSPWW